MVMEGLAACGDVEAGFDLIAHAEGNGLLAHPDENCCWLFRTLLEACRAHPASVHNSDRASRVQAVVDRLALTSLEPKASTLV